MCETCGCGEGAATTITDLSAPPPHAHEHGDGHPHSHDRAHDHSADGGHIVALEERLLAKNDELAHRNRQRLTELGGAAVNVMGSPGAGKTALLERTVRELGPMIPLAVVEGDQETLLDANRIAAAGGRVVQVNTGAGCHLDASMLADALGTLAPPRGTLILVENVGNLVCPALFDLGARAAVVLASVTEGADKPLKYPHMFRAADLVLVTKTDLLPYVDFDVEQFTANARAVSPDVRVARLSTVTGEGFELWLAWLRGVMSLTPTSSRP
jgi:hydrogenase nickel incorporation protein HypB